MDAARRIVVGDVVVEDGAHRRNCAGAQRAMMRAHNVMMRAHNVMMRAHNGSTRGCIVLPGLVQAHMHLCQTLCRGAADDLPLLEWLRQRVWPYEAALDERAMRACARLAVAELLLGGTTAILDMGTVHETDALFDAVAATGLRATIGKAMMDDGDGVPARLRETTRRSLDESDALARAGTAPPTDGCATPTRRASCSRAPRSCCARSARACIAARALHTHASEQRGRDRAGAARARRRQHRLPRVARPAAGRAPPSPTASTPPTTSGGGSPRSGTHVVHCPSSNLKLGSGIAPIPEMLAQGIHVALGADGAPCNNNLDGFVELRLAALLHKPRAGTTAMPAATGARAGHARRRARRSASSARSARSRPGKRADLIVVDPRTPHATPRSIRCRRWSTPRRAATCATSSSTAACSCAAACSPS